MFQIKSYDLVVTYYVLVSILFEYIRLLTYFQTSCYRAFHCVHVKHHRCGYDKRSDEVRWFLDACDISEFNCEYKTGKFIIVQSFSCFLFNFNRWHTETMSTRTTPDTPRGRGSGCRCARRQIF